MPFKLHLIIISCIIVAVLLAWQFLHNTSSGLSDNAPAKSAYSLSVTHASWGLNCRNIAINNDAAPHDAFVSKGEANNKLHEDNVLGTVARLCNGNMKCDIMVDEATLGADPSPDCGNKVLEVEYRCFSYDRPWNVKTATGTLSLHCEQPAK